MVAAPPSDTKIAKTCSCETPDWVAAILSASLLVSVSAWGQGESLYSDLPVKPALRVI